MPTYAPIRPEHPGDAAALSAVIAQAFGRADEARLVAKLRADGDAVISRVAVADETIVGHVLFSRMDAPFRALGLAPLSVAPRYQCQGLGRALVEAGLAEARLRGWDGVFVLGDPAYYGRFGFRADLASGFASLYAGPHFMARALGAGLPVLHGRVDYAPAFAGLG
jgi:putative acetyltransferase